MSMLERAAIEVHEALGRANAKAYLDMPDNVADDVVRAVLAAIREPSADVVHEGVSNYVGDVDAELTWQAMIDAILEGK